MDFNKLPVELQKEIVYDLPNKSMLVSKNFYNYKNSLIVNILFQHRHKY